MYNLLFEPYSGLNCALTNCKRYELGQVISAVESRGNMASSKESLKLDAKDAIPDVSDFCILHAASMLQTHHNGTRNRSLKTQKDLKREYKERKKQAGIFMVKNTVNGKLFLGSSRNLDGPLNRHRFSLATGGHPAVEMQKDWNTYGPDCFVFEILEEVVVRDDVYVDIDDELTILEEIWIEKLQPFGPNGYNIDRKIRQV
jgi:hypothetical protein